MALQLSGVQLQGQPYDAVKGLINARYGDAAAVGNAAASLLQNSLGQMSAVFSQGPQGLQSFLDTASGKIQSIQLQNLSQGIQYQAPQGPQYNTALQYQAPQSPQWATIQFNKPQMGQLVTIQYQGAQAPQWNAIQYNAPQMGQLQAIQYQAPQRIGQLVTIQAPQLQSVQGPQGSSVQFTNQTLSDSLLTALKNKLEGDLGTPSTGLGSAEAALFARETARQNDARAKAYTEVTTAYSSRGFDMPPGALLAKQTELNNESAIRLADSSSQIMAESAKLAQAWNQTTVTASQQTVDLLGKLLDAYVNREFEAGKTEVTLTYEGYKTAATIAAANAGLEGQYLASIGAYNDSIVKAYTGDISAETAKIGAFAELNKAVISAFAAEVSGETARINALSEANKSFAAAYSAQLQGLQSEIAAQAEYNKGIVTQYSAEISGAVAELGGFSDLNKSYATKYSAEAQGAVTNLTATSDVYKSNAAVYGAMVESAKSSMMAGAEAAKVAASIGESQSRIATSLASLAVSAASAAIDAAVRKYTGELTVYGNMSQAQMQLIASAMNSISVSGSLGFSASSTYSQQISNSLSQQYGANGTANPSPPVLQ